MLSFACKLIVKVNVDMRMPCAVESAACNCLSRQALQPEAGLTAASLMVLTGGGDAGGSSLPRCLCSEA